MTEEERSLLEHSDLYARTPILKDYIKNSRISQPVMMELNQIPEQQMSKFKSADHQTMFV
jgi:hypothetical protein